MPRDYAISALIRARNGYWFSVAGLMQLLRMLAMLTFHTRKREPLNRESGTQGILRRLGVFDV